MLRSRERCSSSGICNQSGSEDESFVASTSESEYPHPPPVDRKHLREQKISSHGQGVKLEFLVDNLKRSKSKYLGKGEASKINNLSKARKLLEAGRDKGEDALTMTTESQNREFHDEKDTWHRYALGSSCPSQIAGVLSENSAASPSSPHNPVVRIHPYTKMAFPGSPAIPTESDPRCYLDRCRADRKSEQDAANISTPLDLSSNKKHKRDEDDKGRPLDERTEYDKLPERMVESKEPSIRSQPTSSYCLGELTVDIPKNRHIMPSFYNPMPLSRSNMLLCIGATSYHKTTPDEDRSPQVPVTTSSHISSQAKAELTAMYEHFTQQNDFPLDQGESFYPAGHKLQQAYRKQVDRMAAERYTNLMTNERQMMLIRSQYNLHRAFATQQYNKLLRRAPTTEVDSASYTKTSQQRPGQELPGRLHPNIRISCFKNKTSTQGEKHKFIYEQSHGEGGDVLRRRKFLGTEAVGILSDWYNSHREHPYPTDETAEELADRAQINTSQVKKWMANKRVRSHNTLAFNGSIHPKRLEKMLQARELDSSPRELMSPVSYRATNPPRNDSSGKKRSTRLLDPTSVEALNRWYLENVSYPYPTDSQKRTLAEEANITVTQVTCWFANKRNRSNNTKKSIAKEMSEKMEMYRSNMGITKQSYHHLSMH